MIDLHFTNHWLKWHCLKKITNTGQYLKPVPFPSNVDNQKDTDTNYFVYSSTQINHDNLMSLKL